MATTAHVETRNPVRGPLRFDDNSYARLPDRFFARLDPTPVAGPRLVKLNRALAEELGLDLDGIPEAALAEIFAGNAIPPGAEPLAMAYAGHQFGNFVPQLGDGRAILLGETVDRTGRRRDIQLKGSGRTPFSRGGDGRAALGPVLREYIIGEAMHALGIPTTRALAAVATGEPVFRETPLPGAVLTRIAASHLRVGTFQFFAARRDADGLARLAEYAIDRHCPEAAAAERPALALLEATIARQAALVARWLSVGFIHGVMNTDNTTISGESIDFGPCAFMDAYDPASVFSSIDSHGRYAYANQPVALHWNLARFAEAILMLIDPDTDRALELARAAIEGFAPRFDAEWTACFRAKVGLKEAREGDLELIQRLLKAMHDNGADFTLTFRRLCDAAADPAAEAAVAQLFAEPADFAPWSAEWRARLAAEPTEAAGRARAMRAVNPARIPRNHRVEEALAAASGGDMEPFEALVAAIRRPFDDDPALAPWDRPPEPHERVLQTFCGT